MTFDLHTTKSRGLRNPRQMSLAVLAVALTAMMLTPSAAWSQTLTISPATVSVLGGGGTQTVTVTAPAGLAWTASSTANWISFPFGASGTGSGTLQFQIAANTGAQTQNGTVTLTYSGGSASLPVSEAGLASGTPAITLLNQSFSNQPQQTVSIKVSDPNGPAYVSAVEMFIGNQLGQYYACTVYYWAGGLNLCRTTMAGKGRGRS